MSCDLTASLLPAVSTEKNFTVEVFGTVNVGSSAPESKMPTPATVSSSPSHTSIMQLFDSQSALR